MEGTTNPDKWFAYLAAKRDGLDDFDVPAPGAQEDAVGPKDRLRITDRFEKRQTHVVCASKLVGTFSCIGEEKGSILFGKLLVKILLGAKIVISFDDVESIDSSFLRASFERLQTGLSREEISNALSITNASNQMLLLMKEYLPYLEVEE